MATEPSAQTMVLVAETPQAIPATEAPVAETPVVEPAPPTVPPSAEGLAPSPEPSAEERMQEELRQLRQRRAGELRAREQEVQQQEEQQTLQTYQAALAARLEEKYGLAAEQASEIAQTQVQTVYQAYQQQQIAENARREDRAKVQVATILAQQYGVPIHSLLVYNSGEEMEAMAARMKSEGALLSEVEQLKAQVAKLTKGQVPAQTFASGAASADGTRMTSDNIDALYLKDPTRYGDAYRKFLRTGQI